MRENICTNPFRAPAPPNLAHPSVRSWLTGLPQGYGHSAAFETRLWWSPGGGAELSQMMIHLDKEGR